MTSAAGRDRKGKNGWLMQLRTWITHCNANTPSQSSLWLFGCSTQLRRPMSFRTRNTEMCCLFCLWRISSFTADFTFFTFFHSLTVVQRVNTEPTYCCQQGIFWVCCRAGRNLLCLALGSPDLSSARLNLQPHHCQNLGTDTQYNSVYF